MRHHIFLSYSRRDIQLMRHVRDDLRAAGLDVWTDEGIEPGSISWKEAIEAAIRETGLVVVLLSPDANDSRWVQREIDYAEVQHKPILPLLIRGEIRDAIPFALAGSQFIDMRRNYPAGFSLLLRRCYQYLPASTMDTVPARAAASTYTSLKVRQKRKREQLKQFIASMIVLGFAISILIAAIRWRTQLDLGRFVVSNAIVEDHHLEILYNRSTLVIHNTSSNTVKLDNIVFEQRAAQITTFAAEDWLTQTLVEGRCVQVWDIDYRYLSPQTPPADGCHSRVAYRATAYTFWLSNSENSTFIIKRGNDVLAECPTISHFSDETLVCPLNF